jgi:hypothetical protein
MILSMLDKNLNFEQGSHKIWSELTRITHILLGIQILALIITEIPH